MGGKSMTDDRPEEAAISIWLAHERPIRAKTLGSLIEEIDNYYRFVTRDRSGLAVVRVHRGSIEIVLAAAVGGMVAVNAAFEFVENMSKLVEARRREPPIWARAVAARPSAC